MAKLNGIESQFWDIKKKKVPPLNLKIKIVKKFPEKIYKHAIKVMLWAFVVGEKTPTLVGFNPNGMHFKQEIYNTYVILNDKGIAKEILVHNFVKAYILNPKNSASIIDFSLSILKEAYPFMYDARQLNYIIDDQISDKQD